jgi:ABC-type cobalamin/Fe3+-siderophores transport system ATPase subunit
VGDKHHRQALGLPQRAQVGVKLVARELVQRTKGLVHQQHIGLGDQRALWQAKGLTVVFVTHSIYEAVFLSSRVVMMAARPGRIVADVPLPESDRSEAYRLSAPFAEHCRELSRLLMSASDTAAMH